MIAWIALRFGLSQFMVKLILFAAVSAGILYGLRLWGNAQWAKGQEAGRYYAVNELKRAKEAEWKAERDSIEAGKRALLVAAEQLEKDRANIYRSLNDRLRAVATANAKVPGAVAAISPDQLDGALRAVSRELAANQ